MVLHFGRTFLSDRIPTATKDVDIVLIYWEVICEYNNHLYKKHKYSKYEYNQ